MVLEWIENFIYNIQLWILAYFRVNWFVSWNWSISSKIFQFFFIFFRSFKNYYHSNRSWATTMISIKRDWIFTLSWKHLLIVLIQQLVLFLTIFLINNKSFYKSFIFCFNCIEKNNLQIFLSNKSQNFVYSSNEMKK